MAEVTPRPRVFGVKAWANANNLGENTVRAWCRRTNDPFPHIRNGVHILIDDELAIGWMRRNLGVGCGAR